MSVQEQQLPKSYAPLLDRRQTENAIRLVKTIFSKTLADILNLTHIAAPLFVEAGTGINDDLNGVERPVSFRPRSLGGRRLEVVQSLAKWKRTKLAELGMRPGDGIYADLTAIRPDEELGPLHSLGVDQWDWELVINEQDRSLPFLRHVVGRIYQSILHAEDVIERRYPEIQRLLPSEITFLHSEDLEARYPTLSPEEREERATEEYRAVFIIGVGSPLKAGIPHGGRAPDYDDWSTPNGRGLGLNGDLLVWHPLLQRAMEVSSMGIRVTPEVLLQQLEVTGCSDRKGLDFHRRLLAGRFPHSIGGGIGQSRLCMYILRKAHIGEVQPSVWPEAICRECDEKAIPLL